MTDRPAWWEWELELSAHVLRRIVDRQFNESDLRTMLENPIDLRPSHEPERWIMETRHAGADWCVILEPMPQELLVVVVTAYSRR